MNLKDDLIGLKSKLENIEKEFEVKLKDVEEKESKFKKLDQQLNELISTKDSIIKLNIGGKIFQTKVSTLLSQKDTLFYKLVCANMEENTELNKEIFFDRNYRFFPLILDYLRTKKYDLKGYSKYELEDLQGEAEYYGLTEIANYLMEIQKEIEFVRMEASPQYSTAGTHRLEDLKDRSCMKGVCVGSPYTIIIELNFEHEIEAMEIGGWNGNSSLWYVGNGANAQVWTSTDKANWIQVGTVPSNLSATIQTVKLTPSFARYIKFQHTSYLGIGFLNLIRRK